MPTVPLMHYHLFFGIEPDVSRVPSFAWTKVHATDGSCLRLPPRSVDLSPREGGSSMPTVPLPHYHLFLGSQPDVSHVPSFAWTKFHATDGRTDGRLSACSTSIQQRFNQPR